MTDYGALLGYLFVAFTLGFSTSAALVLGLATVRK